MPRSHDLQLIRVALEEGKESRSILLSEFPEQKDDGAWVTYEEVEKPFADALAALERLDVERIFG